MDEKSCVTFLLCDPGWYVQRTWCPEWMGRKHTHTHTDSNCNKCRRDDSNVYRRKRALFKMCFRLIMPLSWSRKFLPGFRVKFPSFGRIVRITWQGKIWLLSNTLNNLRGPTAVGWAKRILRCSIWYIHAHISVVTTHTPYIHTYMHTCIHTYIHTSIIDPPLGGSSRVA